MVNLRRVVCASLAFVVVVTLTSVVWGQPAPAERTRLAVLPFNVYGLVRDLPDEFGRALAIAVEGQLVRQPDFQVVTRSDLDPLLNELALGQQGVLEPSQAQRLGQLAGAELIITGDLVVESAETWVISARFVAVETGEVQTAVTLELPADTSLTVLANSLMITALPLQGEVVVLEPPRAFISLGSQTGLTNAMTGGVILRNRDVAGLRFNETVGRFTIVQRGPEASLIEIVPSDGATIEIGDIVQVTPDANIIEVTRNAPPTNFTETNFTEAAMFQAAPLLPPTASSPPHSAGSAAQSRCGVPSATVTIPDPVLLAAIQRQLGLSTSPTCADMLDLFDLGIDPETQSSWVGGNAKIRDLNGLETARNLEYLALPVQEITDLAPLAHLAELRELLLYNNQIGDIAPLAGLTNLEALIIDDNRVRDLTPLADKANLYKLWANGNQIRDLTPLSDLPMLTNLQLDTNQIVDVGPLGGLQNLDILDLGDNPIRDIGALRGLSSLSELWIDNTNVRDLGPLTALAHLEQLYLYALGLTNSDLSILGALPDLVVLGLGDNDISDLTPLTALDRLEILYMWNNRVVDAAPLASLRQLSVIYLGGNQIADAAPFAELPLRELWLQENPLDDLSPLVGNRYPDLVTLSLPLGLQGSDAALTDWVDTLRGRGVEVYFD